MKPLTVREARNEDMPAFVRLWRDLNGGAQANALGLDSLKNYAEVLSGLFSRYIAAATDFLAIAEADGHAVGYCLGGALAGTNGEIRQLAVLGEYQGAGVAGALCSFGRDWLRGRGVAQVSLNPCQMQCAAPEQAACAEPADEDAEPLFEFAGCGCGKDASPKPGVYETVWQTIS